MLQKRSKFDYEFNQKETTDIKPERQAKHSKDVPANTVTKTQKSKSSFPEKIAKANKLLAEAKLLK